MTSPLLLSVAAGLLTTVVASLWGNLVAAGMARVPEAEGADQPRDIRTW